MNRFLVSSLKAFQHSRQYGIKDPKRGSLAYRGSLENPVREIGGESRHLYSLNPMNGVEPYLSPMQNRCFSPRMYNRPGWNAGLVTHGSSSEAVEIRSQESRVGRMTQTLPSSSNR